MVEISITHNSLTLEVKGTHKLWALKSRLDIPLEHIRGVHADPQPAMGWFQGLKIAGTDLPNVFRAGMFWQDGNKVFWDVRHPDKTIVIAMQDETTAKLIVEVKDPEAAVLQIRQGLADYEKARRDAVGELYEFLQGSKPDSAALTERAPDRVRESH